MNKETILSRQILTYMLLLTFVIIAIAILGSYLFYSFLIYYLPGGMNEGSEDAMTFLDWMWILMASITSLVVALFFTVKLSARIFNPLNDVAYSLKQISQGNLSARAFNSSSKLGEMNRLVNDFNEMAEKLQTLDAQRNLRQQHHQHRRPQQPFADIQLPPGQTTRDNPPAPDRYRH